MAFNPFQNKNAKYILDAFYLTGGAIAAGLGLKGFLLPNHFIDGGITGVSLLVSLTTGWKLYFLLVIFNAPFIALGYKQLSRTFAIKSVMAILILSFILAFIDFPVLTNDKLLVSIFGGFFIGCGIGLAIRGGGVLDGTEALAIFLAARTPFSIGGIILAINLAIFTAAALILSMESALYSVLIYLVASKTVDFVVHGIEEYVGMMIISSQSEEIRRVITQKLARGATVLKGKRGLDAYSPEGSKIDVIFIVLTRLETSKVKNEIIAIDSNAFIIEYTINNVRGGMVKKTPLSHDGNDI